MAIATFSFACATFAENKEDRKLSDNFTTIEVSKGANVSLIDCDKTALEVVTDGCPTSDVETIVKNGTLTVKMKKRTPLRSAGYGLLQGSRPYHRKTRRFSGD